MEKLQPRKPELAITVLDLRPVPAIVGVKWEFGIRLRMCRTFLLRTGFVVRLGSL